MDRPDLVERTDGSAGQKLLNGELPTGPVPPYFIDTFSPAGAGDCCSKLTQTSSNYRVRDGQRKGAECALFSTLHGVFDADFHAPRGHFFAYSTSRRSPSAAAPESRAAALFCTASRGLALCPAAIKAAAVFASTMFRAGPGSPASSRRIVAALSAGDCVRRSSTRHSGRPNCAAVQS